MSKKDTSAAASAKKTTSQSEGTGRKNTPSFILELEISFSDTLLNELSPSCIKKGTFARTGEKEFLDTCISTANAVYNAALGECIKRKNKLLHDRTYQNAMRCYAACKKRDVAVPQEAKLMIVSARNRAGFSEYDIHAYIKNARHHFHSVLGIDECQKLASRAYRAVNDTLTGNAKKVRFHRWYEDTAVEGKSSKSTLVYAGNSCIRFGQNRLYPLVVKKNDFYAREALTHRVKYVRLVRKTIRNKARYYAQLVLEGMPPATKNLLYGRKNTRVGLDEGSSTLAVCTKREVTLYELAPGIAADEKELRRLNRAMDRSRRATNPDNYNEDGTVKSGRRKWNCSNRYKRLAAKRKELLRRSAWNRKCSHNQLANHIVSLGLDVRVEDMKVSALAKRSKKTTVNQKNGRIRSKKRYGKTVMNRAPASLIEAINRKLGYAGYAVKKVNTWSVKASQYDHISNTYKKKSLTERWGCIGKTAKSAGDTVQRDLYSAFLIMNTNDTLDTIDRGLCKKTYRSFKKLHDIQVETLQTLPKESTLHWYVA